MIISPELARHQPVENSSQKHSPLIIIMKMTESISYLAKLAPTKPKRTTREQGMQIQNVSNERSGAYNNDSANHWGDATTRTAIS